MLGEDSGVGRGEGRVSTASKRQREERIVGNVRGSIPELGLNQLACLWIKNVVPSFQLRRSKLLITDARSAGKCK